EGVRGAEVRGLRALLWLDDDNRAQAVREARQALQKDPAQHEAAIVEATLALWEQRLDESADVFGQVLVRHPDSGRALLGLGQERMLRGDVAAGRTLIERATKVMPDHLGTWHAFAWCQLIEGDLAGARASFEHALAVDRTFGETHGGLALVHALRSERTEAEASIRRAMRLDPNGRTARYARSVLLLDEGLVDEARAEVAQLMTLSPGIGVAISADFIFRLRELVRPRG
ncbi:tetratricopeptide repeat protein, partial [Dyella sp.]|uniref:tetratricopeptide repeat protein n=1 Tax=Dyella sp. TaxID=1869338 RepID=UPI002ED0D2BB